MKKSTKTILGVLAVVVVAAILLDNGQKYAAPASVVHVSLCREGRQAVLSVTSRGDTIPPEELSMIFDRFHKSDRSRSIDKEDCPVDH